MNTDRIEWIKSNPYFCLLPFTVHGFNIEFDGQRNPAEQKTWLRESCCCNLEPDRSGFEDVKQSILANQPNARCRRCYDSEATTGTSERVMHLLDLAEDELDRFQSTKTASQMDFRIKFSNLCNLACRSCSPTFSSKYAEAFDLIVPVELTHDIGENPEVWNRITHSIEQAINQQGPISVTLFGGETLIQPGMSRFLAWTKQHNLQSLINLGITTNLTRVEKIFELTDFRSVNINASIDSVEENYEYIRWPARWSTIENNLAKILPLIQQKKINFAVNPVFSLNNIYYLPRILDFWADWFNRNNIHNVPIRNVIMSNPRALTVQNLPVNYRKDLKSLLSNLINHRLFDSTQHDLLKEYIKGIVDFLNSDVCADQFELYLFDTARHDRVNGTNMQSGNNRLFSQLSEDHLEQLKKFQKDANIRQLSQQAREQYWSRPL